jgi:glucokinase
MIVLAGDVGGTSARLGLFSVENRNCKKLAFERYNTKDFGSFAQLIHTFLAATDSHPRAAAFGIAGPVLDGFAKKTVLPWDVDIAKVSKATGLSRIAIVNDFVAHAHGLDALSRKDLEIIQKGDYEGLANKGILGPGTGCGEAIIAHHGGDSIVVPSEGGHQDFAPRSDLEIQLLRHLRGKYGHVSYERIISAQGIIDIYEFLGKNFVKESEAVSRLLEQKGADKPAIILRNAVKDKLCKATADVFFSVLGAETGNLALQAMAFGGIYIVGGLTRSNLAVLKKSPFLKSFQSKGRLASLMKRIPVYVVKNEELGILGAAALANELL